MITQLIKKAVSAIFFRAVTKVGDHFYLPVRLLKTFMYIRTYWTKLISILKQIIFKIKNVQDKYAVNTAFTTIALLSFICISGIFLSFNFPTTLSEAFFGFNIYLKNSVSGQVAASLHYNSAQIFLFVIYIHIARVLLTGTYFYGTNDKLWSNGISIFIVYLITFYLGTILPMGSLGHALGVRLNILLIKIPLVGEYLLLFHNGILFASIPNLLCILLEHATLIILIIFLIRKHTILARDRKYIRESDKIITFTALYGKYFAEGCFIYYFVLMVIIGWFFPNTCNIDNMIPGNLFRLDFPYTHPLALLPLAVIYQKLGSLGLTASVLIFYIVPHVSFAVTRSWRARQVYSFFCVLFLLNFIILGVVGYCRAWDQLFVWIFVLFYFAFFFLIAYADLLDNTYVQKNPELTRIFVTESKLSQERAKYLGELVKLIIEYLKSLIR